MLLVGGAATGLILHFGISAANDKQCERFDRVADNLVAQFQLGFENYALAALWVHQATRNPDMAHEEFRQV